MQTFFQDNKSDELIVLFCGWGMDEKPFLPLNGSSDILYVFDYSDLVFEPEIDFSSYNKINLVCFSAGVFVAGCLKEVLPNFDLKIAVNGVLTPFDAERGIAQDSFLAMKNLTMERVFEFRDKLIAKKEQIEIFNKNQPARSLDSSLKEFAVLEEYSADLSFEFDKVIAAEGDQIIPFENQLRAWLGYKNIVTVDGGHFVFYNYSDWSEIISK